MRKTTFLLSVCLLAGCTVKSPMDRYIDDLMARTGAFLEEVAIPLVKEGKSVLIVGHGAMDSSIVCHIKNRPLADFWKEGIKNCKLIQLI